MTSANSAQTSPGKPPRSAVGALALALALSVLVALGWGLEAERRRAVADAFAAQQQATALAALAVEAQVAGVQSALAAAAAAQPDPQAAAAAVAKTPVVRAAVVIDAQGRLRASAGDPLAAEPALAAARSALRRAPWSGLAKAPRGMFAPAAGHPIAGGGALAATIDAEAALAAANAPGGALLGGPDQALLAGAAELGAAAREARGRAFHAPGGLTAAWAQTPSGLTVVTAAPSPPLWPRLGGAAAILVLTLLAPVAAAAAALVLQARRAERRAVVAEAKLDNVERHFRLAVDGARAGVWTWRPDEDRMELSPRLQRMLGCAAGEPLSVGGFIALAAREDQPNLQTAFIAARQTGALEASFRIERNGQIHWIEARGVAIADPEADSASAMVGTALDVTPRREAELRTVALERRLKEAIDSFSGPFALYDQRKRLQHWNRSYANLFQLPDSVLRQGASYDSIDVAAKSSIRRERHDPADAHSREIEVASGAWVQLVERRTVDGGLVCVGVDITALKAKEEELLAQERRLRKTVEELARSEGQNKELARKAEEASRAKSKFLANMSHELRTPLNAIMGFSEMIRDEVLGVLNQPKYKEYAIDIFSSGEELLDLINDILDQAKIESGKQHLSLRPLDPIESVEQVVKQLRLRAEKKGLQLLIDAGDAPEIEADHRTVKQILKNLVSNAIKFTESGAVMVRCRAAPGGVLLQVIDTGIGIPKDHLPRLAQPFSLVDEELTRKHGGSGLGLALARTFAEAHGGRLEIESEVGRGTVVSVFLPASVEAALVEAA